MRNTQFEIVYKENYRRIYNHIKIKVNFDVEVTEELTNDVFLKVHEHLCIFNCEIGKISTWIHSIAKNVIIDYYRKQKEQPIRINNLLNIDGVETIQLKSNYNSSDLIEGRQLSKSISVAMSKLNNKQREIAELYFLHNKKYVEIAEILDIPLSNVKVTLMRAKEALQFSLRHVYKSVTV